MVRIPTRGGAVTLEFQSMPERDEVVDILTPLVKKVSSALPQRDCSFRSARSICHSQEPHMSAMRIVLSLLAGCGQGQGASWPTCTGSSSAGGPAADWPACSCGAEEQAAEEGQVRGFAVTFVAPVWPQGALFPESLIC